MLWIKAFHIIFVICWFAGLFYLPRIFVNLAMADRRSRTCAPAADGAQALSLRDADRGAGAGVRLWLWLGYGFSGGWLHAKLVLVVVLIALSPRLRQPAERIRAGAQHTLPCLVSLVQRNPGTAAHRSGHLV